MNIGLWVVQVLLALHTAMGAVWKFTNSEAQVPSLAAIPHGMWLGLAVLELGATALLLLPAASSRLGTFAPYAALFLVAEMLLYCALHRRSGAGTPGEPTYWLVVAAVAGALAFGRFVLHPHA